MRSTPPVCPDRRRSRRPAIAFFFAAIGALAAPAALGCGAIPEGDPPAKPLADPLGEGDRLHEVLGPAKEWLDPGDPDSVTCAKVPADRGVHVTGVTITALDRFDETGDGQRGNFYVQDTVAEPKAYSGVTVFDPSFSPPDLRLYPGDVADLSGVLTEFLGPPSFKFGNCKTLPEIGGTLTFRNDGALPAPVTIPLTDLKSYVGARQWLGMLVKVENVTLAAAAENKSGRFTAPLNVGGGITVDDVPYISNELYDLEGEGPPLEEGATFKSVTGIITFFFGFKLAPRSPADFEL